jgi:hypothetical protein
MSAVLRSSVSNCPHCSCGAGRNEQPIDRRLNEAPCCFRAAGAGVDGDHDLDVTPSVLSVGPELTLA